MSKLLVIALTPADAQASVGFASALALPYDVLLLSGDGAECGAETLFTSNLSLPVPADGLVGAVRNLCANYSHFAAVSSMGSKDFMPRLAESLNAGMVSDAIAVESDRIFKRPIVAGALIETVEILSEKVVILFRPSGFQKVAPIPNKSSETITLTISSATQCTSKGVSASGRPDLGQAKIVVSGGRPLKDKATFESVIGGFADAMGAAVGATRAAVDNGIAPNEIQVGQTGKVVAPELYIAAGISGSTQHMAGIKDSKVIVAINTDANAPIFDSCDIGLVADLYETLPALQNALKS
jgi:electron transfer flavoprotein alpha subunit